MPLAIVVAARGPDAARTSATLAPTSTFSPFGLRDHWQAPVAKGIDSPNCEDHIILRHGQCCTSYVSDRLHFFPFRARGRAPQHLVGRAAWGCVPGDGRIVFQLLGLQPDPG